MKTRDPLFSTDSPNGHSVKSSPARYNILIIDDDRLFCDIIRDAFGSRDFSVFTAHSRAEGLNACAAHKMDVVLLDQRLPDSEGHLLCPEIIRCNDETRIIFVTAFPSFDNAVRAIKEGAHDYLSKPFEIGELQLAVQRSLEIMELRRVKQFQSYRFDKERNDSVLVGNFGGRPDIRALIETAAAVESPVLVTGETGTGKNVVARAIHFQDAGKETPFISINCAALPESLIEAELFGHEKGAFTDARNMRKGIFELAKGGTLFLDEIGEMPPHLQSKLLGVLDEGKIRRLGGESFIPVNVRIIAATNADPELMIQEKKFRSDLFYRLSVIRITLPPLRDRLDELPELCDFFIRKMAGERQAYLAPGQIGILRRYSWPGNIRELRNLIERSLLLHHIQLRPADFLTFSPSAPPLNPISSSDAANPVHSINSAARVPLFATPLAELEKKHILATLESFSFNLTRSAQALGVSLSTLKRKIRLYRQKPQPHTES